jgi:hypothetical protein
VSRAGERLHAAVITQVMAAYARYAVIFVAGVVSCVLVANVLLGGIIVPLNSADFALLHGTIFSPRTSIWTSVQKLEILSPDQHGICSRPTCKNSSHFDAILIAGGGQTPEGPPPHVILRLEKALQIYFAQEPPPFIITTGRGTWHKTNPKDSRGYDVHEASMNAEWLLHRGVPSSMILEENSSMETVGNAFFARVLHADVLSLRHIAVINNEWHMRRTRDVFTHVFSVPRAVSPAGKLTDLTFVTCASGLDAETERERLAREEKAIPKFARGGAWQDETPTLEALHLWVHQENMAYSVKRLRDSDRAILDPVLAKSY